MAMYEREGYCPCNSFLHYQMYNGAPAVWKERVAEILGPRDGYMVYEGKPLSEYSYVVDCMVGCTGSLSTAVANVLRDLIPECIYARIGRKIVIRDLESLDDMPAVSPGKVVWYGEDDRFIVGISDDGGEEPVRMFFYRK